MRSAGWSVSEGGYRPAGRCDAGQYPDVAWAETPADQSLGTVTLLDHRVTLQVYVARVDWEFGDGQSESTSGPEREYDPADHCKTVTRRGYWGHVYASTGADRQTSSRRPRPNPGQH